MNEYVVDVNILFSSLLSQKELYERLSEIGIFYTPDFSFTELQKYRNVILKKSKSKTEKLKSFTVKLFKQIIVIPDYVITHESLGKAIELCQKIDPKDTPYVALAIEFDCILLTRDKPLYDGLKAKGFEKIMLFDEFVRNYLT